MRKALAARLEICRVLVFLRLPPEILRLDHSFLSHHLVLDANADSFASVPFASVVHDAPHPQSKYHAGEYSYVIHKFAQQEGRNEPANSP
jgi:hypothetical protein